MDESDIKVEVLAWVRRACRGRSLPVVASEFSLNGTGIRADLAVLHGSFYGIEIKSAADSLKRLPNQIEGYARYFDRTILVVAPRHLRALGDLNVRDAQVWSQSALAEQCLRRRGAGHRVSGHTLLGLLTADEERRAVRAICDQHGVGGIPSDLARIEFENAFRRRYAATSDAFWEAVRGRTIRRDDLALLSRFHLERQRLRNAKLADAVQWENWIAQMNAAPSAT